MLNFQRIICIWICCVSCMFGTTQLSTSLVQAVPYEYFDDHDQSFYDLDTEQIQAKYDTRLLSQQMLRTETEKGFHNTAARKAFNVDGGHRNVLKGRQQSSADSLYKSTAKLKSNDDDDDDGSAGISVDDWLEQEEETATKAASSTSAFTDSLDELHLPRAASCFTNGQKYTHGQKVPRLDNCEVCLCMDGEIFCWWEKCDKKSAKTSLAYDDFSTPFEESSTTRMQLNAKTTFKTTLKPMKKPKTSSEDYKYDDDDSAEIREMQQEYKGIKEQLLRDEHDEYEQQSKDNQHRHTKKPDRNRNKQMVKKKNYQQQEEEKHKKKIKEQNKNWQTQQQQQKQEQTKQLKSNEHYEQQHHHAHNHNNNNNNNKHHDNASKGSNSKILNFPENLPSVLYYDYKTEEHHQHQHQHREQHLKHQKQKQQQQQQQHEKQLKQQQQQQEQEQEQPQQYQHNKRHHEYGQDFLAYNSPDNIELDMVANVPKGPSTAFKYFGSGNENTYNEDLQTDSDILPEPPTKKPTFLTSLTDTIGLAKVMPTTLAATTAEISKIPKEELTKSTTIFTPLKKQILSSWDNTNDNSKSQSNTTSRSTEDLNDTEDQDDAFHRWLTSTEMNNKNNFTLNETASREEGTANINGRGFGGTNTDYNGDEKIYETIADDTDAGGPLSTIGHTKQISTAMAKDSTKATTNTKATADSIFADQTKPNEMYENEQNFQDNKRQHGNSNEVNNYKSPFGQVYQNYEKTNNQFGSISSGNRADDEDNAVASVVNIDIMLTASSAETQQQKLNFQTPNQQPEQQQLEQQLQNFEHEKQIAKTHDKFMQPSHLITNTNDATAATSVKDNNNRLFILANDNNSSNYNNNNSKNNSTNIIGGISNIDLESMAVNLLNNNNGSSSNNIVTSYSSSSSSNNFKLKNSPTLRVSLTNTTSATNSSYKAAIETSTASTTTPTFSTTQSPERQCNVMGTLYKIGDVLPQDTGNCLQCICIDGSTSDDTPRVTCSPHNCPPLVLPDLFDATGY